MTIIGAQRAQVERVRLTIVPDATTRALELRKGSADISPGGSLSADMVGTLRRYRNLEVEQQPGTVLAYLAFNLRDPILKDVRVRQALAYAIDRGAVLHYLFGDEGRLADSVLPPQHWAYNGNVPHYPYDPAKANQCWMPQATRAARRRALSPDDEDIDGRNHAPAGGGNATAAQASWDRAGHSQL